MKITQFSGESRRDAIINSFSLDIVEQDDFFAFLEEMGYDINDKDELIYSMVKMYRDRR